MRRRTTARPALAACAAVALLAVAGCGSDEDDPYAIPERFEAYCEEVEARQVEISEALASGGQASGLIQALPSFEALAEQAPDDIADEWEVVIERIGDLVDALDAAGVDPDSYDRRDPPAGLDAEEKATIDAAATALVSATTARAMSGVQQHARDVCKTALAL
ncbi:hypothetical protein [Nocardioides bizhenqiangii]|uniref:Uncharacterized protein n=1 Tax=Nocardioides bizhenqiangii TaxID=3095076 RepID=A0ABZ0ZWA7_9ACTN|nr:MULTISPECIES: hypothetical protein [unclassified Nocardioides]MDZ5622179.1 hypothetical protein [Nocardioides sp. HM23]WQQ28642.1 hypothetical protein SHK19_10510 [Nocardioides sp. HM61]